jgi:cell division protein FtsW
MREKTFAPDWWLFTAILALVTVGLTLVYDASYAYAIEDGASHLHYFERQTIAAAIGLGGMFVLMRIHHSKLGWLAIPGVLASTVLLLAVLRLGPLINGAHRWFNIGALSFQPSELAKLAMILFLSYRIAARPRQILDLWRGFAPLAAVVLVVAFLIEKEPDLGTASTVFVTALTLLWLGGAKGRWVACLVALCVIGLGGKMVIKGELYRLERVFTFMHPDEDKLGSGFQMRHSTMALGTGGWTGVGLGESREKRFGGLPERHTDFIYAILGEETGFVGTGATLLLYLLFAGRGYHIAIRTRDPFGRLLAAGITTMVVVQALINVAVVTASVPATGVPLPFLSYGGSALITNLFSAGILLGISTRPYWRKDRGSDDEPRRSRSADVFRKAGVR